jgi:Fe-S oxidoreductase
MCFFPMLTGCVRGKLFEGASTIVGSDIFCNIMWLHFAKNSVIRERLPQIIDNIWNHYLKESNVDELICFHDECYGTYTQVAPAFGIEVPFKPVHLFQYLIQRLDELKDQIRPLGLKVAYQRPCSNRLIPETQHWVDDIFQRIGVERVEREYDRENALCCGTVIRLQQNDDLADDLQERNIEDMRSAGANVCVFNCPVCLLTLGEAVAEKGMMPILMSELCQFALGEGKMMMGG